MFQVKIKSEILKDAIDVLSTVADEGKFNLTKDGLETKIVDPAHVAMLNLTLNKKAFEEFKADECTLGIDIHKLKDVIKLAGPREIIEIHHDEDKNRLILNIGNITRRMTLIDTKTTSEPKIPSLNLPASLIINTDEAKRGIMASEPVSDHVELKAMPEGFEMTAKGDTDTVILKLPKDLLEKLDCKEAVRSLYSLDYLSKMIKTVSSPNIGLHLGNDMPIDMDFDLADGNGHVRYLLAPRIENE